MAHKFIWNLTVTTNHRLLFANFSETHCVSKLLSYFSKTSQFMCEFRYLMCENWANETDEMMVSNALTARLFSEFFVWWWWKVYLWSLCGVMAMGGWYHVRFSGEWCIIGKCWCWCNGSFAYGGGGSGGGGGGGGAANDGTGNCDPTGTDDKWCMKCVASPYELDSYCAK